jgi:hypothetical protein
MLFNHVANFLLPAHRVYHALLLAKGFWLARLSVDRTPCLLRVEILRPSFATINSGPLAVMG